MAKLYYVADTVWEAVQNPIDIGDNKYRREMPYDGEFLGSHDNPRITGHIEQAGSGAGTYTGFQLRNITQGRDYLTTLVRFDVDDKDANGRATLEGGVLCTHPTFRAGDIVSLDCDAIPGGADSSGATIWATCGFWREVD